MKQIPLTCGKFALVDDGDFEFLSQWDWAYKPPKKDHHTGYAVRTTSLKKEGKRTTLSMHRVLTGQPKGMDVDHEDGNGLNNQRYNFRITTRSNNMGNQRVSPRESKTSKYKGVSWHTSKSKYVVQLTFQGKHIFGGRFICEIKAALRYNELALKYFGEFAKLNEVTQ